MCERINVSGMVAAGHEVLPETSSTEVVYHAEYYFFLGRTWRRMNKSLRSWLARAFLQCVRRKHEDSNIEAHAENKEIPAAECLRPTNTLWMVNFENKQCLRAASKSVVFLSSRPLRGYKTLAGEKRWGREGSSLFILFLAFLYRSYHYKLNWISSKP